MGCTHWGGSGRATNTLFTAGKVSRPCNCLGVLQYSSTQIWWRGANGDFPQYKLCGLECQHILHGHPILLAQVLVGQRTCITACWTSVSCLLLRWQSAEKWHFIWSWTIHQLRIEILVKVVYKWVGHVQKSTHQPSVITYTQITQQYNRTSM